MAAWMEDDSEWIVEEEVLKDSKVRFVPQVSCYHLMDVTKYRRFNMHCFCNIPNFPTRLFIHFPNFTSGRRYRTHSFLPSPLTPSLRNIQHKPEVSPGAQCSLPAPLV